LAVLVLDTCVLFPPSMRDLLLTLAALDAYSVRWSDEILTELSRTVTETYPDIDPQQFEATTIAAIRAAFPDAVVTGWEALVPEAEADTIVTLNVRDFAGRALSERDVRVVTPGQLMLELLDDVPEFVVTAVVEMAARKHKPPMTVGDVLDALARHPDLVDLVGRLQELLK
jgi:hypothetical protein